MAVPVELDSLNEDDATVVARLETGDESLRWLEDAIVVGTGKQSGFNPTYDFFVIGRER